MLRDFYDKSEPIVTFEAFYGPKKYLVDKCLVTFSKVIYENMLRQFECVQIAEVDVCNGGIPVWAFEHKGERVAFYLTPIGSALAGGTVAEVNHLTGAHKFVMFGSCGSLDGKKTAGKYIIPTEAYRGEGLSHYFAEARAYIRIRKADEVEAVFKELAIPYVKGRVWTTDSIMRETVNLVRKRKAEGCIAVEMEVAGVEAVCDFYGFELYDFLESGDVLAEKEYNVDGLAGANHNLDKLQIALKLVERI